MKQYHQQPDRKASSRLQNLSRYHAKRAEVIAFLGGKCVRCPVVDVRCLQIDHVDGGGAAERRGMRNYWKLHNLVLRSVPNNKYQLLCANCNWIKKYENGEVTNRRLPD